MARIKKQISAPLRGDKRLRTRAKLIEAAAQVINEKGYDRTTIADVCERAGMSRGAFYNNFADKEELFVAFGEVLWPKIAVKLQPGISFREQLTILGKAVAESTGQRGQVAIAELSFQLYALTREPIRKQIVKKADENYRWGIKELKKVMSLDDLPLPPETFVRVVHALMEGFTALRFLIPELITEDTIVAAFEALAGDKPVPKKGSKR